MTQQRLPPRDCRAAGQPYSERSSWLRCGRHRTGCAASVWCRQPLRAFHSGNLQLIPTLQIFETPNIAASRFTLHSNL